MSCSGIDEDHLSEYFHKSSRNMNIHAEFIACEKTLGFKSSNLSIVLYFQNRIFHFQLQPDHQFSTCSLSFHVFFFSFNFCSMHRKEALLCRKRQSFLQVRNRACSPFSRGYFRHHCMILIRHYRNRTGRKDDQCPSMNENNIT